MAAGVSIALNAAHKLATPTSDPTGLFPGLMVVYGGGHTIDDETWGEIDSKGQWWFQLTSDDASIGSPVAVDVAFKEKDDTSGTWNQRNEAINKMDRPGRGQNRNWDNAPPEVTWGINAHGGGQFDKYTYVLKVSYTDSEGNEQEILVDPEIHHMKM